MWLKNLESVWKVSSLEVPAWRSAGSAMLWEDSSGRICRSPIDVGRKSKILNVAGKPLCDLAPFASPVSSPCSRGPLWFPQPGDGDTALLPASPTPFRSHLLRDSIIGHQASFPFPSYLSLIAVVEFVLYYVSLPVAGEKNEAQRGFFPSLTVKDKRKR